MAEDTKQDRPLPETEALDQRYIREQRSDESNKWCYTPGIRQSLRNSRSFWQQLVDWAHQYPPAYAAIAISTPLLITGALVLSVFFGGIPILAMAIGSGIAILLAGLISAGVYFDKPTRQSIELFIDALSIQYATSRSPEDKQTELNNAIKVMSPSMRATANALVETQKNEFAHKKYEVPFGIQAKEKLRQLFQNIPNDFPFSSKDFIDSQNACCKPINNRLFFQAPYEFFPQRSNGQEKQTCETKVKFFIHLMQAVFKIPLECKNNEKTRQIDNCVSGSYSCEITEENLNILLNTSIETAQANLNTFYKAKEEKNAENESLCSAKADLISTLKNEWATGNATRESIVNDINKTLKITSSSEEFLTGTCELFERFAFNDGDNVVEENVALRKEEFKALKVYLNDHFGKNLYTFTDNSGEESNTIYRENITITFNIPIADAEDEKKLDGNPASSSSPQNRFS
jgi:hypothetical protein